MAGTAAASRGADWRRSVDPTEDAVGGGNPRLQRRV